MAENVMMIEKLKDNWGALVLIAAILIAGSVGGSFARDKLEEIAANTQDRLIRQYKRMDFRRRTQGLGDFEHLEFCRTRAKLGLSGACPPPSVRRPGNRVRPPDPRRRAR